MKCVACILYAGHSFGSFVTHGPNRRLALALLCNSQHTFLPVVAHALNTVLVCVTEHRRGVSKEKISAYSIKQQYDGIRSQLTNSCTVNVLSHSSLRGQSHILYHIHTEHQYVFSKTTIKYI